VASNIYVATCQLAWSPCTRCVKAWREKEFSVLGHCGCSFPVTTDSYDDWVMRARYAALEDGTVVPIKRCAYCFVVDQECFAVSGPTWPILPQLVGNLVHSDPFWAILTHHSFQLTSSSITSASTRPSRISGTKRLPLRGGSRLRTGCRSRLRLGRLLSRRKWPFWGQDGPPWAISGLLGLFLTILANFGPF
jgi:hypothetical protein